MLAVSQITLYCTNMGVCYVLHSIYPIIYSIHCSCLTSKTSSLSEYSQTTHSIVCEWIQTQLLFQIIIMNHSLPMYNRDILTVILYILETYFFLLKLPQKLFLDADKPVVSIGIFVNTCRTKTYISKMENQIKERCLCQINLGSTTYLSQKQKLSTWK